MTDIWNKRRRSKVMSLIRSSGNKTTELRLAEIFRCSQITGWRRRQNLTGKPDFVFRKERLCVFVDGCFWHGCPRHGTQPKQNAAFWQEKIARNKRRDRLVARSLRRDGWKVVRIWEHQLHSPAAVVRCHRPLQNAPLAATSKCTT
jgi:DNA mismatch endonuclease (patch repair protein)